jgi:S-adenosylmethionine decarboxylase
MFGPHLTLDLYGCDEEKLNDYNFIYKLLDEMPGIIGMTKISPPSLINFPGNPHTFDKGGLSGFVLITESHISIHTFPEQKFASVDIFSCKEFDTKKAESYLIEKLDAKKVEKHFIMRGKDFPKDVKKAEKIVIRQRKSIK